MTTPPYLNPGDTIGIVATARFIEFESIRWALKLMEKNGFRYELAPNLDVQERQWAGDDIERAENLTKMIENPEIKAIWVARGGYGSIRIIQHLSKQIIRNNPKWLIGFSDVTVLHQLYLIEQVETIHATMPINITETSEPLNVELLFQVLTGHFIHYQIQSNPLNVLGRCSGKVVGGNLSIIYSLRGTPFDLKPEPMILFLEDIDEYLYHIDRMVMNIRLSNWIGNVKGLIIGSFTEIKDNQVAFGKSSEEIVLEHFSDLGIPICFGFPAGHDRTNQPILMGRNAVLTVTKHGSNLVYDQSTKSL